MHIGWTKKCNTVYNNIFKIKKEKKKTKETSIVSTGIFLQAGIKSTGMS